ncbi:MAG TPA: type II toxin-antitoxin system HicA family toxin [Spirochaetes bacterium]|nr:type II toxin-antitoxin system HicA family toxin [Spirochaetota bacterium]
MLFTDVSSERAINAFKKAGFIILRESKHTSLSKEDSLIQVPRHKRLNPYTLRSIIKDSGLTDEEFKKLL